MDDGWDRNRYHRFGSPKHWVFYVVANINGHYYPLAASCHAPSQSGLLTGDISGYSLSDACFGVISAFGDAVHHLNISAEVEAAHAAYANASPRNRASVALELPLAFSHGADNEPTAEDRLSFKYGTQTDFPFISAVLLRGLPGEVYQSRRDRWVPVPLDHVYLGTNPHYGAVIIDISDLKRISYAIVASKSASYTKAERQPRAWGPIYAALPPVTWMVDEPNRAVLSFHEYMRYFELGYRVDSAPFQQLLNIPVADTRVLDIVWPTQEYENTPLPTAISEDLKSLTALSIAALVKGTENSDKCDPTMLEQIRSLPGIAKKLRRQLKAHSTPDSRPSAIALLVCIAFEGLEHISLARVQGLSFDTLSEALQKNELRYAKSINFCIDKVQGGNPETLFRSLSVMPNLDSIYVMSQTGGALNKDLHRRAIWLIKQLVASSYALTLRDRIFFGALYAASIVESLPFKGQLDLPANLFPVTGILYREDRDDRAIHREINLDNMLLGPAALLARLCRWLQTSLPVFCDDFAFGADTSDSFSVSSTLQPLPVESDTCADKYLDAPKEILRGRWVVLLWYTHSQNPVFNYAFVRQVPDHNVDLQVVGAEEFLALTMPGADIGRLMDDVKNTPMVATKCERPRHIFREFFENTRSWSSGREPEWLSRIVSRA